MRDSDIVRIVFECELYPKTVIESTTIMHIF